MSRWRLLWLAALALFLWPVLWFVRYALAFTPGAGPQAELSVRVARSRCLAMAQNLRLPVDTLREMDWHIHVSGPEGPKDGVSLGWPVVVAMASHLAVVPVDARFAFYEKMAAEAVV